MKVVRYSQRRLWKWDALSLDVLVPARHEGREGLDVVLLDLVAVHPTQTEPIKEHILHQKHYNLGIG